MKRTHGSKNADFMLPFAFSTDCCLFQIGNSVSQFLLSGIWEKIKPYRRVLCFVNQAFGLP